MIRTQGTGKAQNSFPDHPERKTQGAQGLRASSRKHRFQPTVWVPYADSVLTGFTKADSCFSPDSLLVIWTVSPQTVLNKSLSGFDTNADQVIEIAVWKPLYVQINRRALNLELRTADDVNLMVSNREGLQ